LVIASASVRGQDANRPISNTADLDRQIYELLRPVINAGADLYNRDADRPGCYRLYQGSLLTLRPLLAHRPELQKTIDTGLADAERMPDAGGRAFALRFVLDNLRAKLRPASAARATEERKPSVSELRSKAPRPAEPGKLDLPPSTLWLRLGGETGVRRIVDDWVKKASEDPLVNFTRGGKFPLTGAAMTDLRNKLVDFISQVSGGPNTYKGKGMKEAHKGMNVTDAEFDAFLADLKSIMAFRGMKEIEIQDLLKQLEPTRKDIVESSKPEAKK
jgi:truncated hemoglobin YjbI